jgi:hypothetical protein
VHAFRDVADDAHAAVCEAHLERLQHVDLGGFHSVHLDVAVERVLDGLLACLDPHDLRLVG